MLTGKYLCSICCVIFLSVLGFVQLCKPSVKPHINHGSVSNNHSFLKKICLSIMCKKSWRQFLSPCIPPDTHSCQLRSAPVLPQP